MVIDRVLPLPLNFAALYVLGLSGTTYLPFFLTQRRVEQQQARRGKEKKAMTSQKWSRFEQYLRWYLIFSLTLVWIVGAVMRLSGTWKAELFDLSNRMFKQGVLLAILYVIFYALRSMTRWVWKQVRAKEKTT